MSGDRSQTTRPFKELADAMTQESRARAGAKAAELSQTTMMAVAYVLQTAAEDEFDAWPAQQSDEVRAQAEADQVELWARGVESHG